MAIANAPSRAGELLSGKYRLEELLAMGGMGEVYRAVNIAVDRPVAIKLLRPELTGNKAHVQRFIREGRAANRVHHPSILSVLDIDRDGEQLFIVQDLLEGEDLERKLKRDGRMRTLDDALDVLIPVAEALGAAHAEGLVHRDLKPANIFLAREGERCVPKILDFGIAKITAQDGEGESLVTHTGVSLGTPAYMSPEQVMSPRDVDARADVWALGVLLHRMLSGKLPFRRESAGGLMVAICTEPHRKLADEIPNAPPRAIEVVDRCLRKDPNERFPNGQAVAETLRAARGDDVSGFRARGPESGPESGPEKATRPPAAPPSMPELELELPSGDYTPPAHSGRRPRSPDPAPRARAREPEARPAPALTTGARPAPATTGVRPAPALTTGARAIPSAIRRSTPPPAGAELRQLAIAVVPVTVTIVAGWSFDAHESIGGLRKSIGAPGCVIFGAICAAAAYQAVALSAERSWRSPRIAAVGFAALAIACALSAFVEMDGDAGSWAAWVAVFAAVLATAASAFFGLTRAQACMSSDPPRHAEAAALAGASLLAGGAALRLLF